MSEHSSIHACTTEGLALLSFAVVYSRFTINIYMFLQEYIRAQQMPVVHYHFSN
uniref:Uncharacterized protein n=2 Tax=Anguilla anguilla TaxID=7936 RepID=A0A0E9R8Z5_ANGAN